MLLFLESNQNHFWSGTQHHCPTNVCWVRFTESVTAIPDWEFKLHLFLKLKTQSFPHLRVKKLRVCTKPASWKTPQKRHPAWCLRAWSLFNPPSDRKLLLKPKWTDPSCRFGAVLEGIWPATGQKSPTGLEAWSRREQGRGRRRERGVWTDRQTNNKINNK